MRDNRKIMELLDFFCCNTFTQVAMTYIIRKADEIIKKKKSRDGRTFDM